jgi:1,4-alpha-glucan branching enzyme
MLFGKKDVALPQLDQETVAKVTSGSSHEPHSVLGAHAHDGGWIIRTLKPLATKVFAQLEGSIQVELEHLDNGLFQGFVKAKQVPDYRIVAHYLESGKITEWLTDDPYHYLPTVGEVDLHLIAEGRHEELWKALGSQVRNIEGSLGGSTGTSFAVWAPNARNVSLLGDFNNWDGRLHQMRKNNNMVWEIFIPELGIGAKYKYEIKNWEGHIYEKSDPYGFYQEVRPKTASIVTDLDNYQWRDQDWLEQRRNTDPLTKPVSVYELHLGSWLHTSTSETPHYLTGEGEAVEDLV